MNRKIGLALVLVVAISSVDLIGYIPKAVAQSDTNVYGIELYGAGGQTGLSIIDNTIAGCSGYGILYG